MRKQKKRTSRLGKTFWRGFETGLFVGWLMACLFISFVRADEGPGREPDPIGFGVVYNSSNQLSLSVGDYNLFDQARPSYQLRRYGGGGARLQFGNTLAPKFDPNFGFHAQGNSGTTLIGLEPTDRNMAYPQVGLEFLNGRASFNTNRNIQDYYEAFVGPSLGAQVDINGCRLLPLVKAGGAAGTLGKNGVVPDFNVAYGYGFHMSCYKVDVSYGNLYLYDRRKDKQMEDVAIMFNLPGRSQIGLQYENTHGLREEQSYGIMFKNILK